LWLNGAESFWTPNCQTSQTYHGDELEQNFQVDDANRSFENQGAAHENDANQGAAHENDANQGAAHENDANQGSA